MPSETYIHNYFLLKGPTGVLGGEGTGSKSQIELFVGVVLGAISKAIYDFLVNGAAWHWVSLAIALIASVVIFPQLYYTAGLDKRKLSFAHWTLAFQNGFFWSVVFDQLAARAQGGHT